MSHATLISALAITMALAGFVFGVVYFATLRRTIVSVATRRGGRGPLVLTLGRIGAAVLFLAAAARLGAAPLLAALLGFMLARTVAVRAARRSL
jgi:hypothetical protein